MKGRFMNDKFYAAGIHKNQKEMPRLPWAIKQKSVIRG